MLLRFSYDGVLFPSGSTSGSLWLRVSGAGMHLGEQWCTDEHLKLFGQECSGGGITQEWVGHIYRNAVA
jgi:hypothetical protein